MSVTATGGHPGTTVAGLEANTLADGYGGSIPPAICSGNLDRGVGGSVVTGRWVDRHGL